MLAGQGPHLPQPLRPPGLAPRGRARRGAWDDTKALIDKGHDWIINEVKASGLRGPRRRGLPDRPQVVVHAQERPAAILPRHQCRRDRARLLQGPRDHAARPASADRGGAARLLRHARAHLLHLRARRVHPRARAAAGRGRRGLRGQARSARTISMAGTSTSSSTTAPAPTSAARRRRCWRASKARRACRA